MGIKKRQQRQAVKESNTKMLDAHNLPYEAKNNGTILLLRNINKPKIDYYPGVNKWKIIGVAHGSTDIYRTGNVNTFVSWYQGISTE
jgi:hypothetical protein